MDCRTGLIRGGLDPSLLYIDGGVDLYVPDTQPEGHLDSMGVAHMIGEPGATAELSGIGPRSPLLDPGRIVFYGPCLEHTEDAELGVLRRHDMPAFTLPDVGGRAEAAAAEARALVEGHGSPFLVHFDVDVPGYRRRYTTCRLRFDQRRQEAPQIGDRNAIVDGDAL